MSAHRQTQTDTGHGNCWQTAVACVLGVPAYDLPDQVAIERAAMEAGKSRGAANYHGALNVYLWKHHGMGYAEVYDYAFAGLTPKGLHVMQGPTVRTETNGGVHHIVVGYGGEMVWDPHPSRAGLLVVERWGIIAPVPERLHAHRRGWVEGEPCLCPKCLFLRRNPPWSAPEGAA